MEATNNVTLVTFLHLLLQTVDALNSEINYLLYPIKDFKMWNVNYVL